MRKNLLSQLEIMNQELDQLIETISKHGDAAINHHPKENKWSTQQIMNHLILSEKLSIKYCRKKLSFDPQLKKAGWNSAIKDRIVTSYYLFPIFRLKAPKGIDTPVLPKEDSVDSLEKNWRNVREDMRSFIETVDEKYLDKEVYKHPFAGRLTLKGMMSFFLAHFRHHRKQIDKALNSTIS